MFSEPLVAYPLVRVTDVSEATLAVSIADARETGLIRRSIEQLPDAIRNVGEENAAVIEAGLGAIEGALWDIEYELERQSDLLSIISGILSAGFARLAELGEAQLGRLEAIEDLLLRPLDTSARELRERGLRGYRYGLYDEALADLTTAVQNNVYDHIAHLHIGHIHLLRREPEAAVEAYNKAVRYALAAPEGNPERSDFHGAMANLGLARSRTLLGEHYEACGAAQQAAQLAPDRADTRYEHARCALLVGYLPTAEREWSACLSIEPLPFLVVAAAESDVALPFGPIEELGGAALHTQERLRELATELNAIGQKLGVGAVSADSLTASPDTGVIDTLRRNREIHNQLVQAAERIQQSAESRRSELEQRVKEL